MKYYKVVTNDLKSLGLRRNPNIMTFKLGKWVSDKTPLFSDKRDNGGIWVANGIANAKKLRYYMNKEKGTICRIFAVEIGKILYRNNYRVKTDKVRLLEEMVP